MEEEQRLPHKAPYIGTSLTMGRPITARDSALGPVSWENAGKGEAKIAGNHRLSGRISSTAIKHQ